MNGRSAVAKGRPRRALKYFDKALAATEKTGAEYEHASALIDKSLLDNSGAKVDRENGLTLLESFGCVLPDAEVEYLTIDRQTHYARAAAAREQECAGVALGRTIANE